MYLLSQCDVLASICWDIKLRSKKSFFLFKKENLLNSIFI